MRKLLGNGASTSKGNDGTGLNRRTKGRDPPITRRGANFPQHPYRLLVCYGPELRAQSLALDIGTACPPRSSFGPSVESLGSALFHRPNGCRISAVVTRRPLPHPGAYGPI